MGFFHRKKRRVFGVMDVGSDAIKSLLFELPEDTESSDGTRRTVALPQPIEKFIWELPEQYSGLRLARKIREGVFRMMQHLQEVPEQIIIAVGPTVAECRVDTWSAVPGLGGSMLTRRDIRAQYHDLFASHNDLRRAVIVAPIEVLVNGYPLTRDAVEQTQRTSRRASDAVLPRSRVQEIVFRTLSLHMTVENGATFAEIKNALAGMPIEFIPLAVAYKEAITRGLGIGDALVVDVGGNETTVLSVRNGQFSHVAFMPHGTRRFAERLAKKSDRTFREAQKAMRGHATALPGQRGNKQAEGVAVAAAAQWKQSFVSALGSFAAAGPVSDTLLLAGGGAHLAELRSALMAGDWMGGVSHATVPKLRVLDGSAFFGGDTLGGHVAGPENAGLAALTVYVQVRQPIF
ncbi:MAG: hypothetical protein A2679_00155 [Candidatus Sungbacteria bacterium RIFCSPHIGHO2_01_FULL_54_26]|nr:MAG: hypothetical protein A2679_00155 [Candidatus Sungbacteria bacterium RIFCSPHIGHO2_01_FULL_54_26]